MNHISFSEDDLDQDISVEMSLRQAVYLANILNFLFDSGLAFDDADTFDLYEVIFSSIVRYSSVESE